MGLLGLGALRGLWGVLCACKVRRLWGLWRVSPFVFFFSPLVLSFSPFVLISCLASSLACFPALLVFVSACVVVVGFLSLSDYTQKERAQSVSLASYIRLLRVAVMRLPIARGIPAILF